MLLRASSNSLTVLSDGACARSCASRRNDPGSGAVPTTINAGQMHTSRVSDCSHYPQPAIKRDAPDEETNDWRAVCGRTASTVGGRGSDEPSLPLSSLSATQGSKTWMAGTSPAMTRRQNLLPPLGLPGIEPAHRGCPSPSGSLPMISLSKLQRRIWSGELSPEAALARSLEAIEAQDRTIGAFVCRAENP